MAAPMSDLSSGLPAIRESVRAVAPDVPFWSENLLFAIYDPTSDVALWLHLGTVPNDWGMWHEMCYASLPGDDGVLSMWSYHRTAPERRPGGANSSFRCIEPFRRWRVEFDGFGLHTTNADMDAGLARVGPNRRFVVDLDIEAITPVWDAHTSAESSAGKGSMHEQGWAKEHYEQLYRARGTVDFGGGAIDFDGSGWRDHSQGPRGGGGGAPWGGHVIMGTLFPESGRGWGLSRYWTPDGTISLEGGYVVVDGELHHAEVTEAPRLRTLTMVPEELPIGLRWAGGSLEATVTTRRSLWLSMMKGLVVGKDLDGPGLMYVLNHGPSQWDGETGVGYVERSDFLNAFPELDARVTDNVSGPSVGGIPLKRSERDPVDLRRALAQWLIPHLDGVRDLEVSALSAPGGTGVANETLMFDAVWREGARDAGQRFVVRLASERPLYLDADIQVHYQTYAALADVPGVPVPKVVGYEADPGVLGAPFFVMERIDGEVPADTPPWASSGFVHDASPERRRAMWDDAVRVLAALHDVDADRLPFLLPPPGQSGLEHHLAFWRRSLDAVAAGLAARRPRARLGVAAHASAGSRAHRPVVGRLPVRQHHVSRRPRSRDLRLGHGVDGGGRRRPRVVALHGRTQLVARGHRYPRRARRPLARAHRAGRGGSDVLRRLHHVSARSGDAPAVRAACRH